MSEPHHHSKPIILQRARRMRHGSAPAEELLWSRLRNSQLDGLKFRRQHPIGSFIADFFCQSVRLIVELDGDSHDLGGQYDESRTLWLQSQAIDVVRYTNGEIFENIEAVLGDLSKPCRKKVTASTE